MRTLSTILCGALIALWTSHAAAQSRCIAVVGTNDLHGAIEPYALGASDGSTAVVRAGGVVGLSGYISALRAKYGKNIVLLDGGDLFQGTLASNLSQGRAVIDAYNLLGYTAAAIGNHEFDFGAVSGDADRLGVIKQRIAQARFPFLVLNIFDRATGKRVAWPNTQPSILIDVNGIKVGILGVSTPETPTVTKPENVTTLEFRAPLPLVLEEARSLRQRGAELVLLVGHMGGKCKDLNDPYDVPSCSLQGSDAELLTLLRGLPKGTIDVAVGGHTHQFVAHWVNGTATIESGARGNYLGYVEACVGKNDGVSGIDVKTSTIHAALPLCMETWADGTCRKRRKADLPISVATFLGQPVTPMPAMATTMQPYLDEVATVSNKPVGVRMAKALSGPPLAGLVAEAMRRSTHADFGLQNQGGIRASLPAGQLTYNHVFQVLPFDNNVVRMTLSGAKVEQLVALLSNRHAGRWPSLAGLRVSRKGGGFEVTTSKGQKLDPNRRYTFSTSDFIVQGGEGADAVLHDVPAEDIAPPSISMRDSFIELLTAVYPG